MEISQHQRALAFCNLSPNISGSGLHQDAKWGFFEAEVNLSGHYGAEELCKCHKSLTYFFIFIVMKSFMLIQTVDMFHL